MGAAVGGGGTREKAEGQGEGQGTSGGAQLVEPVAGGSGIGIRASVHAGDEGTGARGEGGQILEASDLDVLVPRHTDPSTTGSVLTERYSSETEASSETHTHHQINTVTKQRQAC